MPTPQQVAPDWAQEFTDPPGSARPTVYWAWMNGHVTREGITADLEAMRRVGVGGVLHMNVSVRTPEGPVRYLSPEWRALLQHAQDEAARLGLSFGLYNADGWALCAAPWITPEASMKRLTWTETLTDAAGLVDGHLPQPPTNLDYYRDVAVVAYPRHERTRHSWAAAGVVSGAAFDPAEWPDGTVIGVPATYQANAHLTVDLGEVVRARTLRLHLTTDEYDVTDERPDAWAELEASTDGAAFTSVARFPVECDRRQLGLRTLTAALRPVEARYFRLTVHHATRLGLADIELTDEPMIHLWEMKSGLAPVRQHGGEYRAALDPGTDDDDAPEPPVEALDLTELVEPSGRLRWQAPTSGPWTIVRIGYTTTGKTNSAATPAGEGLECDKFDAAGVGAVLTESLAPFVGAEGVVAYAHSDSYECGISNWTAALVEEFRARRGYDPVSLLPVLTGGLVIGTRRRSEAFLWDVRKTLAELFAQNYLAEHRELCHRYGIEFQSEAAGRQQYLYDPINYHAQADRPMGEFWLGPPPYEGVRVDCRVAASVAHTYGKDLVSAEGFTSHAVYDAFTDHPGALKRLGDEAFCEGVNNIVVHRSAHQPWTDVAPGMTYGPFGIHFERTNTWWEHATGWLAYLARCQYLLRRGRFVADVIHYVGDDVPTYAGHRDEVWKPIPPEHDYDVCNLEILERLTVHEGRLTLPSGMTYRVLLLPDRDRLTPAAMRQVARLAAQGAAIVAGPRPVGSPSLEGQPRADADVRRIADRVWPSLESGRACGWPEIFARADCEPDCEIHGSASIRYIHRHDAAEGVDIYFLSNQDGEPADIEVLFRVTDAVPQVWDPETGRRGPAPFHETRGGRTWLPLRLDAEQALFVIFVARDSGVADSPSATLTRDGVPALHERLAETADGHQAMDVWRPGTYELVTPTGAMSTHTRIPDDCRVIVPDGRWQVEFPQTSGEPAVQAMAELTDWTANDDPLIKYFSGTATYHQQLEVPDHLLGDSTALYLDLGDVRHIAAVELNGTDVGTRWRPPYLIDVTAHVTQGRNHLVVRVTNTWVNRLIGDEREPDDCEWTPSGIPLLMGSALTRLPAWFEQRAPRPTNRVTFTTWKHYTAAHALSASGLLGPVSLQVWSRLRYT